MITTLGEHVIGTYAAMMQGDLRAHIAWDTMRLREREQSAREFPSVRTRRAAAYMRRKVASMEADLQRQQERQVA
jgi:hypothetical protein